MEGLLCESIMGPFFSAIIIPMSWCVYILECKNKALYTGITTDLKRRFAEHRSGRGARYTRANVPRKVVYCETCKTRSRALKREAAIKKLPRRGKMVLVGRSNRRVEC